MKQVHIIMGEATVDVFHIAGCKECEPILPIPFNNAVDRNVWAALHIAATGHTVTVVTEIRINTKEGSPDAITQKDPGT